MKARAFEKHYLFISYNMPKHDQIKQKNKKVADVCMVQNCKQWRAAILSLMAAHKNNKICINKQNNLFPAIHLNLVCIKSVENC